LSLQSFLLEYGRVLQVFGVAVVVLAAGWFSQRAKAKLVDGWTHSSYTVFIKVFSMLFLAFVSAAVCFNGRTIFNQDWWVAPAFLGVVISAYLFAYEVFFASLRWNSSSVEVRRFPFGSRTMKFEDIASIKFHSASESVTLRSKQGALVWFPYGYRIGVASLFALMQAQDAGSEDQI